MSAIKASLSAEFTFHDSPDEADELWTQLRAISQRSPVRFDIERRENHGFKVDSEIVIKAHFWHDATLEEFDAIAALVRQQLTDRGQDPISPATP